MRSALFAYTVSSGNFLPFRDSLSVRNYLSSLLNNREEHSSQRNVLTDFSNSVHLSVPELCVVRQTSMVNLIEAFCGLSFVCARKWMAGMLTDDRFLGVMSMELYQPVMWCWVRQSWYNSHICVKSLCCVSHHANILNCIFNLVARCWWVVSLTHLLYSRGETHKC